MSKTCLVLAGGLGTRMSRHTKLIPKSMIPVLKRPFLHFQLDLLELQGFKKVIFLVGYRGEQMVDELSSKPHRNLNVQFLSDGESLLGTGGSLRRALELENVENEFFVTYGDSYLRTNPALISESFNRKTFSACMTLYNNLEKLDTNNAHLNQDGSVLYKKNAPDAETLGLDKVDFGMSLLTKDSVLNTIPKNISFDLATYFEILAKQGKLQGYVESNRFYEIGSEKGLSDFEEYVRLNIYNEH
jgi:NDP-sugar pyrophosphorylase family protein